MDGAKEALYTTVYMYDCSCCYHQFTVLCEVMLICSWLYIITIIKSLKRSTEMDLQIKFNCSVEIWIAKPI